MKTFGDLKVGDEFYLIEWEGCYIENITKRVVGIIKEIRIGIIIKYLDDNGDLRAFTIENDELSKSEETVFYCTSACSDVEYLKILLEADKNKFDKRYNKLYNIAYENNK